MEPSEALMSQAEQPHVEKLILCAKLSDYAYSSGNPEISDDELLAKWPPGYRIISPRSFFTRSWFQKPESQHRFFKSHAYVCRVEEVDKPNNVNQIVVGFRGTWLYQSHPGRHVPENVPEGASRSSTLSKISNSILNIFAPSNYGLADLYYDATLIRVPYHQGVVWKWYTYWGTLLLKSSNWARRCFAWPRQVATGLIYRPDGAFDTETETRYPLVHLGFWALWASPEGFAGYDRDGHLWKDQKADDAQGTRTWREQVRPGVLQCVIQELQALQDEDKSRETEILVVGHSLGGAVSCFAALDIVAELQGRPKVKVFHATFGAPPVGTRQFAEFFRHNMRHHDSWAVFHERDIVPKCFAYCGSTWWAGWLGWWSNWSRVGTEMILRRPGAPPSQHHGDGSSWRLLSPDGFKVMLIGSATLGFLGISSLTILFSIPVTLLCWLVDWPYYSKQKNPPANLVDTGRNDEGDVQGNANLNNLAVEYHFLERYIELLRESI